jgi:ATP-dependent DNA ligase
VPGLEAVTGPIAEWPPPVGAEKLPRGAGWSYELKLDGYRVVAFKSGGRIHLRSRNDKDFNARYPAIARSLAPMPDETVIDGEIVALDSAGRRSFNALQSYETATLIYYGFDVMILAGKDVMNEPLSVRRQLLQSRFAASVGRADPRIARTGSQPTGFDQFGQSSWA